MRYQAMPVVELKNESCPNYQDTDSMIECSLNNNTNWHEGISFNRLFQKY